MSAKRESRDDDAKTNLIVNYLPQEMTDEHFRVLFAKYGDIRSARIIRNKNTNYSYGFGFVDYFNPEDAEQAIEHLNGSVQNGKSIKVAFARPSSDEIKNANLYITNLPPNFTESKVTNLFSPYGEIIQCRLLGGNRQGSAFVLFNLHEQARKAMKALDDHQIQGTDCRISVKLASSESFKKGFNRQERTNYNGNHSGNQHSNGKYHNRHKPSGPIRSTSHSNRYNPMSQQYGFSPDMLPNMYGSGNQYYQSSHNNYDNHYDDDDGGGGEHILFVYNIGPDPDESELIQLFGNFGHVLDVRLVRHQETGECRGYAFITMNSHHSALRAIDGLNGYQYYTKPLQVSFKKV